MVLYFGLVVREVKLINYSIFQLNNIDYFSILLLLTEIGGKTIEENESNSSSGQRRTYEIG